MYHNDLVVVAMQGKWNYKSSGSNKGGGEREGVRRWVNSSSSRTWPDCPDDRPDSERTEPPPTPSCHVKERASMTVTGGASVSIYCR